MDPWTGPSSVLYAPLDPLFPELDVHMEPAPPLPMFPEGPPPPADPSPFVTPSPKRPRKTPPPGEVKLWNLITRMDPEAERPPSPADLSVLRLLSESGSTGTPAVDFAYERPGSPFDQRVQRLGGRRLPTPENYEVALGAPGDTYALAAEAMYHADAMREAADRELSPPLVQRRWDGRINDPRGGWKEWDDQDLTPNMYKLRLMYEDVLEVHTAVRQGRWEEALRALRAFEGHLGQTPRPWGARVNATFAPRTFLHSRELHGPLVALVQATGGRIFEDEIMVPVI